MMPSPGTLSVRAEQVDLVDGVCGSVGCGAVGLPLKVGVLLFTVLVAVGVLATLRAVSKAGSVVAEERERTRAERDAFADFERRIAGLETAQPSSTPVDGATTMAVTTQQPTGQLDRLKDAYGETVMDVPHYDEEYDEPMEVHMTAELGEEAAAAVFDGPQLTPQLKRVLVRQASEARTRRERLLDALDREEERLAVAREKLEDVEQELERTRSRPTIERSYDELASQWERLGALETTCRELLTEHQTTASDLPGSIGYDGETLREYLYGHLSTRHPVLSDGTRLVDRIQETREETLAAITRRV